MSDLAETVQYLEQRLALAETTLETLMHLLVHETPPWLTARIDEIRQDWDADRDRLNTERKSK